MCVCVCVETVERASWPPHYRHVRTTCKCSPHNYPTAPLIVVVFAIATVVILPAWLSFVLCFRYSPLVVHFFAVLFYVQLFVALFLYMYVCVYACLYMCSKCSNACMLGNVLLANVHCSVSFYNDTIWQAVALDSNVFNTETTQWARCEAKIFRCFMERLTEETLFQKFLYNSNKKASYSDSLQDSMGTPH